MELKGYRETIGFLAEVFPGKVSITPDEASIALGCDVKTVYNAINRVKNPIPAIRVAPKKIIIPIPAFARWLCQNNLTF